LSPESSAVQPNPSDSVRKHQEELELMKKQLKERLEKLKNEMNSSQRPAENSLSMSSMQPPRRHEMRIETDMSMQLNSRQINQLIYDTSIKSP